MRSANCLRLARQSVLPTICARSAARSLAVVPLPWKSPTPDLYQKAPSGCRCKTTSASSGGAKPSRFVDNQDTQEDLSPFKRHRQVELREDQKSEDPLYPEPYPRLESSDLRKSVPEFLQDFQERLSEENVILTGRVRSKRVVGKSLIFVDIVNEFQRVQVMINKNKCVSAKYRSLDKFALFKNLIQVGDHICRPALFAVSPPFPLK